MSDDAILTHVDRSAPITHGVAAQAEIVLNTTLQAQATLSARDTAIATEAQAVAATASLSAQESAKEFLQQTKDERDRILNAGGTIEDGLLAGLIDPILRTLKDAGELSNLVFLGAAGAREVVSGAQKTQFDWSGNQRDASQSTSSQRFTDTTDTEYGGRTVASGDGSDDLSQTATFTAIPTPFTILSAGAISGAGNALVTTTTSPSGGGAGHIFDNSGAWALFNGGSIISGGTTDTNPHVFESIFDGASSELWVDGNSVVTGDPGSDNMESIVLQNNIGNSRANAGEGAVWIVMNGALSSSLRQDLRALITDYYGL